MVEINQFEKKVQTEISNLVDIPNNYNDLLIVSNNKYEEGKKVTIYQMKLNSIIITAPSLYNDINKYLIEPENNSRIYIDQLKHQLNLDHHKVGDKTIYLFLNPTDYKEECLDPKYSILSIDETYNKQFEEFKNDCSKRDLDEGLVSIEDPVVFGCFHEEKLVGVTSYWFWGETIADIGVVIHPKYRKKGIGKALVSKLCDWGINKKK
jgi:hypothetical protein